MPLIDSMPKKKKKEIITPERFVFMFIIIVIGLTFLYLLVEKNNEIVKLESDLKKSEKSLDSLEVKYDNLKDDYKTLSSRTNYLEEQLKKKNELKSTSYTINTNSQDEVQDSESFDFSIFTSLTQCLSVLEGNFLGIQGCIDFFE